MRNLEASLDLKEEAAWAMYVAALPCVVWDYVLFGVQGTIFCGFRLSETH